MKIGILTFHRSINYGAVTQCYALATRLQNDFPEDTVEVIDYVPAWRVDAYKPTVKNFVCGSLKKKNGLALNAKIAVKKLCELCTHPAHYKLLRTRYYAFQRSMKILPLSKTQYRQNDSEQFRQAIKGKYDLIIAGSDCVWEWTTIPLPSPYYLFGDFGARKASFAASAGTDDYKLLEAEQQEKLRTALRDFSYIGVRDTATEYNVRGLCPELTFAHNCDPTTFLNLSLLQEYKEKVKEKMTAAGIDFEKPVVCIMGNEKLGKLARDIFRDEVQLVGVYVPNAYCDVFLPDLEVPEWATIFGLCRLTFTTFFHGTMLSLVNHVPVLSFDYLPETDAQHTKLHELYDRLRLPAFYERGKRSFDAEDIARIGEKAKRFLEAPPTAEIIDALTKEAQYYDSLKDFIQSIRSQREN